jgi:[ribosomal protein S18]-alanine N-acetyltransferase
MRKSLSLPNLALCFSNVCPSMSMKIRLADEADLQQLTVMSEAADSAAHWTQQQWTDIFRTRIPARLAWIAEQESSGGEMRGIGFLVAQNGGPEWELENMAVLPAFCRQGVGRGLLLTLLAHARSVQAARVLLEVRASNLPAIRLYGSCGFQLLGKRRDYYGNPAEDALILVHTFCI